MLEPTFLGELMVRERDAMLKALLGAKGNVSPLRTRCAPVAHPLRTRYASVTRR